MKTIYTLFSLFVFLLGLTFQAEAQSIRSSGWPALAANDSNNPDFADLDEEIEDLEDLADDDVQDANLGLDDSFSSSSRSRRSNKTIIKRTRKSKSSSLKGKRRPKKRIVRRVIRKKRPARRNRNLRKSEAATLVSKITPVTKKRNSGFLIKPFAGGTVGHIRGGFLENTFSNSIEDLVGFTVGAVAEWHPRASWFGVEAGAHYGHNGAEGSGSNQLNTTRLNYICNEYLYIPANLKLYPIRLNKFEMFLKAGVQYGFLLKSTFAGINNFNQRFEVDGKQFFKDSDFQGNLGLGGLARLSTNISLGFEFVYNHGFTDIANSVALTNVNSTGSNDAYNRGFVGTLGVVIDL